MPDGSILSEIEFQVSGELGILSDSQVNFHYDFSPSIFEIKLVLGDGRLENVGPYFFNYLKELALEAIEACRPVPNFEGDFRY